MFPNDHSGPMRCKYVTIVRVAACAAMAGLSGCSASPSALLSPGPQNPQTAQPAGKQPTVAGSEHARLQAMLKNCPTAAEPAKTIGVAAMLEQARLAKTPADAPKSGQMSKAETDCLAARVKAQLLETGSLQAPAKSAQPAPAKGSDLTIDFDSETSPVSQKDKRAIAEMLAKKGATISRVKIFAGRGGSGNMFDQAVVAQKRANRVKELLPASMVVSVEFDPQQVDDTVRIEFVDKT